jgi:hypothetical protein
MPKNRIGIDRQLPSLLGCLRLDLYSHFVDTLFLFSVRPALLVL